MPFAAALSEHPIATQATGEVVGHVLDALGDRPDLVVLFVSAPHVGVFEDIAGAVQELLQPGAFVGTTAVSVVGGGREVEEQPAVSLWAAKFGPVVARHLDTVRTGHGTALIGLDTDSLDGATGMLLLADPASFPVDDVLAGLHDLHPDLPVIGGVASAGFGRGNNRLVVDGVVHIDGAAAVIFGPSQHLTTVVSQGCRPIGEPLVVTRAEQTVIYEIAGQPALARLEALFAEAPEETREQMQRGLHLGFVIDEHKLDFERGDFLIRNILGADREAGSLTVGDLVEVGSTVQFHIRDADSADEDLRAMLTGHRAAGALVFTCNGRGMRLFGTPDHDAEIIDAVVDRHATAGMFCAGEIGPVGERTFLHGFTASVALFED